MNNIEWCYVESALPGSKKWDFCKPTMDYDKVRITTQDLQKLISKDLDKINPQITQNIQPSQHELARLKRIASGQNELLKKFSEIFNIMQKIDKQLLKLYNTKDAWENQEKLTKELNFQIQQKSEKIKEQEDKEIESIEDPNELYRKEGSHEIIFGTKKAETKICKGLMLYDDEEEGDGLIGMYYDNESWIGSYKERKDPEINFDWSGIAPKEEINPNNFSIVWKGYIYIPYSGLYTFTIEADDGVELYINKEIIVRYNMENSLDDPYAKKIGFVNSINENIISSNKIHLNSGAKISIILRYFHSIHNDVSEDQQSFIKLFWSSDELAENIIPGKYLFSSDDLSPLKITGFELEDAILLKLDQKQYAFKDSDKYIIQDIPPQFINMMTLKLNKRYKKNKLSFKINSPSVIYIAALEHYPYPLPEDFEITGLELSLLYIPNKPSVKSSKKILAANSASMKIYKKSFSAGKVDINLNNKNGINQFGIPLVIFIGFDTRANSKILCTGKEMNLTNSNSNFFNSCQASSEKDNWKCINAFNEKMRDEEGGMWASNNEGEGAWIEVQLNGLFEFTKFFYKDKKNPAERNRQLELLFSNGKQQTFNLKNSDDLVKFSLDSVRASSVKITIKSVYGSINNGGAFKFYGFVCANGEENNTYKKFKLPELTEFEEIRKKMENSNLEIHPIFQRAERKPPVLGCNDSISNSIKFDDISMIEGSKILVKCFETCASSDMEIYGGPLYSKDSVICKAAFHSGKLSSHAGLVLMEIKKGMRNYLSIKNEERKISSKSKAYSAISISFEVYKKEDPIILKKGSKVDYLEQDQWKKALIESYETRNNENFIKIIIENDNRIVKQLKYPNSNIASCGKHTKNRLCKNSIKNYKNDSPIKIRFTPPNFPNDENYLPDNGEIYGLNGKGYGWSRSMKDSIFTNENAYKSELESYVVFPPSQTSKFCNRPNPDIICDPATYAIWVGKGKFKVKLFIGDLRNEIKVHFTVNGKEILKNQIIKKNELKIFQSEIDSSDEFILITSECKEDCSNSQSKLNAIEVELIKENTNEKKAEKQEKKTDCGDAFIGSRCERGPDVLHCLFNDKFSRSAGYCSAHNSLMKIPDDYKCKDQRNKYKCVRIIYNTENECNIYCPQKCKDTKCLY